MKFGKKYKKELEQQPEEWRNTAIQYSKLKKVVNAIASELAELGLTADVLKDLLENREEDEHLPVRGSTQNYKSGQELARWDSSDADNQDRGDSRRAREKRPSRKSSRRAKASYELGGTSSNPEPRIHLVFESASSQSVTESSSDGFLSQLSPSSDTATSDTNSRFQSVISDDEDDRVRLERIPSSEHEGTKPNNRIVDIDSTESRLLRHLFEEDIGIVKTEEDIVEQMKNIKMDVDSKEVKRRLSDATIRSYPVNTRMGSVNAAIMPIHEDMGFADDEQEPMAFSKPRLAKKRHHIPRRHRKDVYIPLTSDTEFFSRLAHALNSLAILQKTQKMNFIAQVSSLSSLVSQVSSPTKAKNDLYIWREIFTLWIEAQIFESDYERDRGERSPEDAQERLEWFVDQVAKQHLASRMKNKQGRETLERFINLNVTLLDLKKFQLANEEAARKILKKHDKRTALNATVGFPQFLEAASLLSSPDQKSVVHIVTPTSSPTDRSKRVLTIPGFPTLPHVLLSTLTERLLPIIPQLDVYSCLICSDVAYRPIKLDCGHWFCVRCLVKMQKRGQDACPQCRAPVVLQAGGANLDKKMEEYLEVWFPREVKRKRLENEKEAREEAREERRITSGNVERENTNGRAQERCIVC